MDSLFAQLMNSGLGNLISPTSARIAAGGRIPSEVAWRLAQQPRPEDREHWKARFMQFWFELRAERGKLWSDGWDELVGGFAAAIDLLHGVLPREIAADLVGTPGEAAYRSHVRRFQRFVLGIGVQARVLRLFVDPQRPTENWYCDGGVPQGRSHTLMLRLLADGAIPETFGPVSATGDLEGEDVRQVLGLEEKFAAWWQSWPKGTLITPPPDNPQTLANLTRMLCDIPNGRWLVGASLAEVRTRVAGGKEPDMRTWDGTPLLASGLQLPYLRWAEHREVVHVADNLVDAATDAWAATSRTGKPHGVLVLGAAGSGKSILSLALVGRFDAGPLSALGFAVRVGARKIAEAARLQRSKSWSELLAGLQLADSALLAELERTRRLVPIVDGLDELSAGDLQTVIAMLRQVPGWWIATARPIPDLAAILGVAHVLNVEPFSADKARACLTAAGRAELGDALFPKRTYGRYLPAGLEALTKTPLHLSLLSRAVPIGSSPQGLTEAEIYRRSYEALLGHAAIGQRLSPEDAAQLQHCVDRVVGELALAWLSRSNAYLERHQLVRVLEEAEIPQSQQVSTVQALEFGHLLVPCGDSWEFAHRTLAEWTAAQALRRRVARTVDQAEQGSSRAESEWFVLQPWFGSDRLPREAARVQLLRFYVPFALEPLALVDRLLGADSTASWRVPAQNRRFAAEGEAIELRGATVLEMLENWDFAFEVLATAQWTSRPEAQRVWVLAVRQALWLDSDRSTTTSKPQIALIEAVGRHLPRTLEELVRLAAPDQDRRRALMADPTPLLPMVPSSLAPMLDDLLATADRGLQLAVLRWHEERGVVCERHFLDRLASTLLDENGHIAGELESAVWKAYVRDHCRLPLPAVRRRLHAWPGHLHAAILAWLGVADLTGEGARERRNLLVGVATCAASAFTALQHLLDRLATSGSGQHALQLAMQRADFKDATALEQLLSKEAELRGWRASRHGARAGDAPGADVDALYDQAQRIWHWRRRLVDAVAAVHASKVDDVVGAAWTAIDPAQPTRVEVLDAAAHAHRVPNSISVATVLARVTRDHWALERVAWSPEQLSELDRLSSHGRGQLRFDAICLRAALCQRQPEAELVAGLADSDDDFVQRVLERVDQRNSWDTVPLTLIPQSVRAHLPVAQKAALQVEGWKAQLLQELADPSGQVHDLARIVAGFDVQEALPILIAHLEEHAAAVIPAIAKLVDQDEVVGRRALLAGIAAAGAGGAQYVWRAKQSNLDRAMETLVRFIQLEDVDFIARHGVSALAMPWLAGALRALQDPAWYRLLELYGSVTPARRTALAETILAACDPQRLSPNELVDVLFLVVPADKHEVYSSPGPLGKDFDDPSDLDWDSTQLNKDLVAKAVELLKEMVRGSEASLQPVRRLFEHPSETIVVEAFTIAAAHTPEHALAEVAIAALDGYVSKSATEFTGTQLGLLLASGGGGSGSINVFQSDTPQKLVAAIEARLTPAHVGLVTRLVHHRLVALRAYAARWAVLIGADTAIDQLLPLLADESWLVVAAMLDAVSNLAPARTEFLLAGIDRTKWSDRHDVGLLQWLCRGPSRSLLAPFAPPQRPGECVSPEYQVALAIEAGDRAISRPPVARSVFAGFPCLVEEVFSGTLGTLGIGALWLPAIRRWACSTDVRGRHAACRILIQLGEMTHDQAIALTSSEDLAGQLSGAECVLRAGPFEAIRRAGEIWNAAFFAQSRWSNDQVRQEGPSGLDFLAERLLWSLVGAPVQAASLLSHVLKDMPLDHDGMTYSESTEDRIRTVWGLVDQWGNPGVLALLELMDARSIDDHWQFQQWVASAMASDPSVEGEVRRRAAVSGTVSAQIVADVDAEARMQDLKGFEARLVELGMFPVLGPRSAA